MAHINDLAQCSYLSNAPEVLAVGWLEKGSIFPQGQVSPAFFEKLQRLCADPWQPVVSIGQHECSLCQFDAPRFSANIFIPYSGRIYAAPVAVVHYIAAHWYLPPEVFIQAVLECPDMKSMEYKKALLANGGRGLIPV